MSRTGKLNDQQSWDGQQLRAWREKQGLSVRHVAAEIGVSPQSLYAIEKSRVPRLDTAHRIVNMTHGAIRYRDIYYGMIPEYA